MSNLDTLYVIYNYITAVTKDLDSAFYFITYIFSENGVEDEAYVKSLYDEMFADRDIKVKNYIGPFYSLDEINKYSYMLCEKLNVKQASLISVQDYNLFMEKSTSIFDLKKYLIQDGNILKNLNLNQKSRFNWF